jgi:hypothetical protein
MSDDMEIPKMCMVRHLIDTDDLIQFKRLVLDDASVLEERIFTAFNCPYPFHYALYKNKVEIAKWLVDHVPVDQFELGDFYEGNAVVYCVANGYPDILENMLKRLPTLNINITPELQHYNGRITPLFIACCIGDIETARVLLKYGADVNRAVFGDTALDIIMGGSFVYHLHDKILRLDIEKVREMARLLMSYGAKGRFKVNEILKI